MTETTSDHAQRHPSLFAAVLSFLIPGLGQIYQGRFGKGFLFMSSLLGMFLLGQAMGAWRNVYLPAVEPGMQNVLGIPAPRPLASVFNNRWHYAGQFWIGMAAWPALWQFYEKTMPTAEDNPFWHDFQRAPRGHQEEMQVNEFLANSDKTPDLGWVYTVIAGMLNILVIYDAFAGPAYERASAAGRAAARPDRAQPEGVPS